MPGVLPVMNRKAVEYVVRTGLALNCDISSLSRFARKNYFYPDLPKGYQISQFEFPLCEGGHVVINGNGTNKKIGLTRIHLEEDAGKNIHEGSANSSFVDLNRAGVPLMEIVSEPDIRTAKEAVDFVKKLRTTVRYIDVCDGNMEQGSLRCDANVSVRPEGAEEFGVKTEIKNMNSFRFIEKALDYEIKRQIKVLQEGGRIVQETRLWNSEKGITESMRSKEEAHDYRYFPDPDLVPIEFDVSWTDGIRANMPELPDVKKERFMNEWDIAEQDAELLASERSTAEWFEEAVNMGGDPKSTCNWMKGDFMKLLNEENIQIDESRIKPGDLVDMLALIDKGTISGKIAKIVFEEMYKTGKKAGIIVEEKGLVQISDASGLESIIDDLLAKNADAVNKFKAGENKLMGFFVGQVMKETKGKANPGMVNELLRKKLG
jgi:aspartyl-tRNA(Asn)/glutamyl-tRNA(Gln) amidotransferase subunit B